MTFQVSNFNRKTFLYYLENLSPEQLYFIPKGFKNNILWNIGHILITEQMLTYGLSGLKIPVDKKFVELYAKGTFPQTKVSKNAVNDIKKYLINANKQTQLDIKKGTFRTYNKYETSIGITLNNVEEALQFNLFHEGIHLGIIMSLKKFI
jgi:hypothetical protein